MNVPKIRFSEFNDEYRNINLKYVFSFYRGNTLSKSDIVENGNKKCILYGELYTKYSAIASNIYSRTNNNNSNLMIGKKYDVLMPSSGETALDISTTTCLQEDDVIIGGDLTILRPKDDFGNYLSYYLFYKKKSEIAKYAQGDSIVHLYADKIKNLKLNLPSYAEQKKVSKVLEAIDKKIELQSKKIEDLKLLKKGLLEKEFSKNYPEINLTKILKERKLYSEKGLEYPHVTLSKDGIYDKSERYDRDFLVKSNDKQYKITRLNDLCYNPANLKFGVISLNEYGSAIFSPIYVTFEINKNANPLYIKYYTTRNNFINAVRKYEQGTVYERMAVSPEDFLKFNIKLPSIEIQNNIVNKFKLLDKKIKLEQSKLDKINALKKGFMQSMFV